MSELFIKLKKSDKTDWLQKNHPNAFLLLCQIARRAKRTSDSLDKLKIGEALIGDYHNAGIETRDKYRTALDVLIFYKFVMKISTCRDPHSIPTTFPTATPISTPTKGTKVKLTDSTVCDVNINNDPHIDPHYDPHTLPKKPPRTKNKELIKNLEPIPASATPLAGEEKISPKSRKRKKVAPGIKIQRDVGVETTELEHEKLILARENEEIVKEIYSSMAIWKNTNGIAGGNDYLTALKWNLAPKPESEVEENKKYSLQISKEWFCNHYEVEILSKTLEIVMIGCNSDANNLVLRFEEKGFKNQVDNFLRKRNFQRISENKIVDINANAV